MTLEYKVTRAELAAVIANRYAQEVNVEKLKEQMDRLLGQIEIQVQKESELQKKLNEIGE